MALGKLLVHGIELLKMKHERITPQQIRAALGMLGWTVEDLAQNVGMLADPLRKALRGEHGLQPARAAHIQAALERQGLRFTPTGGVEPDYGLTRVLEGSDAYAQLLDEVARTLAGAPAAEALFMFVDNSQSSPTVLAAHHKLRAIARCRYLCREQPTRLDFPASDYRALPAAYFHNAPQVVFGDYMAYVSSNKPLRIVVMRGADVATSARFVFDYLWQTLPEPAMP
jgi:hypothetical protein